MGHIARGLALAEAWPGRGGRAQLVVPETAAELAARMARDLPVTAVEGFHDPAALAPRLGELAGAARWVVVDGYDLVDALLQAAEVDPENVVRIDDHGHHPRPRAAVVVDPNLGASAAPYAGG